MTDDVRRIAEILEAVGPVTLTENLRGARWSKLALNCAVSALGTIAGERLGPLVRVEMRGGVQGRRDEQMRGRIDWPLGQRRDTGHAFEGLRVAVHLFWSPTDTFDNSAARQRIASEWQRVSAR